MEEPYLVPDYFSAFSCKMGDCRRPCCEGWPISITMKDYFQLLSVPCSPELRRKLDCCLHLAPHPTEDAYAQIQPRYDGVCPLHLPDGRCGLHAECGEQVLSAVCRLYPRGVRNGQDRECSCANSCEAVLELLLHHDAPLTFTHITRDFGLPDAPPRQHFFHTAGREQEIRLWLISMLQRREYSLPRRMLLLGAALHALDEALTARDDVAVDALLNGNTVIPAPELPQPSRENLSTGLSAVQRMLAMLDESSVSIRAYGEEALAYFSVDTYAKYEAAISRFQEVLPQWGTWFEHLLVNHLFFVQFPFQDRPVSLRDEYLALVAVYTLLRFMLVGCLAEGGDEVRAVDVAAAAFRLVDHTEFDRYAAPLLHEMHCDDHAHLCLLLSL
ncbi:MAG: flagellin lysine-N-methylase [Clostridiales bacterium]|nr:flagellin lysine-N-methylase [Clostridiales bacterium]